MKTPAELSPQRRAELTELRAGCEKFIRRHAGIVKKLKTERYILSTLEKRIAAYEAKIAENPGNAKATEALNGYKLQEVLLCATIGRGEAKLAKEVAESNALMSWASALLRKDFAEAAPEALAQVEAMPTETPEAALLKMIAAATAVLGDGEERACAVEARTARNATWFAQFRKELARQKAAEKPAE